MMRALCWLANVLLASACEPHCASPCAELNGNVQGECGDCPARMTCNARAADFRASVMKVIVPPVTQPTIAPPSPPSQAANDNCPTYPLGIERASFEKEYCVGISERPGSGVALLRGIIGSEELLDLRALFDSIPYPNRYLCGHSDDVFWTPDECLFDAEMLLRRFPRLYAGVREAIGKRPLLANERGQHEMVRINNLRPWHRRRNLTLAYADLLRLARDLEGRTGYQSTRILTTATGAPFFDGLHWWHRDRQGGMLGKLWLLAWRAGAHADSANQTGLAVVPADAFERYAGVRSAHGGGPSAQKRRSGDGGGGGDGDDDNDDDSRTCTFQAQNFSPDKPSILDELSCTISVQPGDAVYYSNQVWHRSQDALNDREALSMDVTSVATGEDVDESDEL
jgi:hypothetical protein